MKRLMSSVILLATYVVFAGGGDTSMPYYPGTMDPTMTANIAQIAHQFTDEKTKKIVLTGLVAAAQNSLIQDTEHSPKHFFSKKFILQGSLPTELTNILTKIAVENQTYQSYGYAVQSYREVTLKDIQSGIIIDLPKEISEGQYMYNNDTSLQLVGWIGDKKIPLSVSSYAFGYWERTLDARVGFLASQLYAKGYIAFDIFSIKDRIDTFITQRTSGMTDDQKNSFLTTTNESLLKLVQKSQNKQKELVQSVTTDEQLGEKIPAFRREQVRIDVYNGLISLFNAALASNEAKDIINEVLQ